VIIGERSPRPSLESEGPTSVEIDAASESSVLRAFDALRPIDHVVVAISAHAEAGSIVETSLADASEAFQRFWGIYNVLRVLPGRIRPDGSVTLISGSSGRRAGIGFGVWTTLHGSIEALARAATIELAPIRVNVVSPGGIGLTPDRQLAHHRGSPEDVALMVVAGMASNAVTGAVIDVDGGERLGKWSG
jgi:NAD(P)-dependent dehydrogenase (short-subunit alcohol dehydrogenase family)